MRPKMLGPLSTIFPPSFPADPVTSATANMTSSSFVAWSTSLFFNTLTDSPTSFAASFTSFTFFFSLISFRFMLRSSSDSPSVSRNDVAGPGAFASLELVDSTTTHPSSGSSSSSHLFTTSPLSVRTLVLLSPINSSGTSLFVSESAISSLLPPAVATGDTNALGDALLRPSKIPRQEDPAWSISGRLCSGGGVNTAPVGRKPACRDGVAPASRKFGGCEEKASEMPACANRMQAAIRASDARVTIASCARRETGSSFLLSETGIVFSVQR
mmetsp:Transcript_13138/g.38672  ORF Transcript_13138/g.38672 Transcript_13138/m.38672 type:complete len:271 (+) Transcript_13138:1696-2508(+)